MKDPIELNVESKYKILDLVFCTTLFTFIVVVLTMCIIRDDERIFRNLHTYETGGFLGEYSMPSTYFPLDWLVHPITRHKSTSSTEAYRMNVPLTTDRYYSSGMTWSNSDCGPSVWQQSDFCPSKDGVQFESGR